MSFRILMKAALIGLLFSPFAPPVFGQSVIPRILKDGTAITVMNSSGSDRTVSLTYPSGFVDTVQTPALNTITVASREDGYVIVSESPTAFPAITSWATVYGTRVSEQPLRTAWLFESGPATAISLANVGPEVRVTFRVLLGGREIEQIHGSIAANTAFVFWNHQLFRSASKVSNYLVQITTDRPASLFVADCPLSFCQEVATAK